MSSRRRSDAGRSRTGRRLLAAALAGLAVAGVWTATAGARARLEVSAVVPAGESVSLVAAVRPAPATLTADAVSVTDGDARLPARPAPVLSPALVAGLVLDTSAAGAGALQAGANGAGAFLMQLPSSVRTVVVADGGEPRVLVPPGAPPAEALSALTSAQAGGSRDTLGALNLALAQLPAAKGPRLLVLHTGAADAGGEPAGALAQRLRQAGVLLSVVSTGSARSYWDEVAGATGGVVVAQRGQDGLDAFDRLATGLQGRWVVTFRTPATLPATVRLRVSTADGPVTADVRVPLPAAAPTTAAFAPPVAPAGGGGGFPLLAGLLLAGGVLMIGGGTLVGIRTHRRPAYATPSPTWTPTRAPAPTRTPRPTRAPAAAPEAAVPVTEAPGAVPLPRRVPGPDQISRRPAEPLPPGEPAAGAASPARDAPAPLPRRTPGPDQISRKEEPASPRRTPHPAPLRATRPEPADDADDRAYQRLDSEVGRIAADVVTKRLEFRRGVARIAASAARRPDLLERLIETEQRLQGALLGGSPPSGVTLQLLVAARGVVMDTGSDLQDRERRRQNR